MSYRIETEQYIFNCLSMYFFSLWKYREDAMQEIRIAIFISEDEKEALRAAGRMCYKMLKEYGCGREYLDLDTPYFDSGNAKKDYLTEDDPDDENSGDTNNSANNDDSNILESAITLYGKYKDTKEVCWHLGINYNNKIEKELPIAYTGSLV